MTTRRHLTLWHTVQLSTAAPIVWCTNLIPRKRPDLPQLHSRQLQRVQRLLRRPHHLTPLRRGLAHPARGRFQAQRLRLRCLGSRRMRTRARFGANFPRSGLPRRGEKQRCHRNPVRSPDMHAANATRWGAPVPRSPKRKRHPARWASLPITRECAGVGGAPLTYQRLPRLVGCLRPYHARVDTWASAPPITSAGRLHCPGLPL